MDKPCCSVLAAAGSLPPVLLPSSFSCLLSSFGCHAALSLCSPSPLMRCAALQLEYAQLSGAREVFSVSHRPDDWATSEGSSLSHLCSLAMLAILYLPEVSVCITLHYAPHRGQRLWSAVTQPFEPAMHRDSDPSLIHLDSSVYDTFRRAVDTHVSVCMREGGLEGLADNDLPLFLLQGQRRRKPSLLLLDILTCCAFTQYTGSLQVAA